MSPDPDRLWIRPVPLSWLNSACMPLHHLGVILGPGARSIESLLLARPVTHDDRPLRVRIRLLEQAHRLEHNERAGAVVRRAGPAVPRVEVRGEHDVFVRLLAALHLRDGVEHGLLAAHLGFGAHAQRRPLVVLGKPEHQPIVLAGQLERRHDLAHVAEDASRAPTAVVPARRDHAGRAGFAKATTQRSRAQSARVAGLANPFRPSQRATRASRVHAREGARRSQFLPLLVRPARWLGEGGEHEFPACLRQPRDEGRAVSEVGQDNRRPR